MGKLHARLIKAETRKTVLFLKEKNQKNFSAKLRFASFKPNRGSKTQNKRNEVSRQNSFSVPFSFKKKEQNLAAGFMRRAWGKLQGSSIYFSRSKKTNENAEGTWKTRAGQAPPLQHDMPVGAL